MGRKLYVGNLPRSATEQDISDKFSAYGTVESAKLITDRDTGQSRGFGFIEMASDAEAQAAIDSLNGTDYDGRPMKVNEARPKGSSGGVWNREGAKGREDLRARERLGDRSKGSGRPGSIRAGPGHAGRSDRGHGHR